MKVPGMDANRIPRRRGHAGNDEKHDENECHGDAHRRKKKIRDWNCEKYRSNHGTGHGPVSNLEIWATEDIKVDYELFARYAAAMMLHVPGAAAGMDDMVKEMKKVKGVARFHVLFDAHDGHRG